MTLFIKKNQTLHFCHFRYVKLLYMTAEFATSIVGTVNKINAELESQTFSSNISVSKILELIAKPFDAETQALNMVNKYYNNPSSPYFHMSADDIKRKWEAASSRAIAYGSKNDDYVRVKYEPASPNEAEIWKLDNNYDGDAALKGYCDANDKILRDIAAATDYAYIGREIPMKIVHDGICVHGRLDFLMWSPSRNSLVIIDWKTTSDIKTENRFQRLLGPLCTYDDCQANKYTIQLQLYKKAFVETYKMFMPENIIINICQLKQDGTYKVYNENLPYDSELLNQVITFANKKNLLLK